MHYRDGCVWQRQVSIGLKVANALGPSSSTAMICTLARTSRRWRRATRSTTNRAPWLERIRDAAYSLERKNELGVIVCSALRSSTATRSARATTR